MGSIAIGRMRDAESDCHSIAIKSQQHSHNADHAKESRGGAAAAATATAASGQRELAQVAVTCEPVHARMHSRELHAADVGNEEAADESDCALGFVFTAVFSRSPPSRTQFLTHRSQSDPDRAAFR